MSSSNKIDAFFPFSTHRLDNLSSVITKLLRKEAYLLKFSKSKKPSSIVDWFIPKNATLKKINMHNNLTQSSLYRYFIKKYSSDFYQKNSTHQVNNQNVQDGDTQIQSLKNLTPNIINRLIKSSCPICSDLIIKDFPINRKDQLIEVIKESDLKGEISEKLSEKICFFANKGLGYIYLVSAIQGDIIKQGFYSFSYSQKKILIETVSTAVNSIINKEQLTINTHRVSLLTAFDVVSNSESPQFIIKLTISAVCSKANNKTRPIFYKKAPNRSPQLPPIYLFYKKSDQEHNRFEVQNAIKQQIYLQIGKKIKEGYKISNLSQICTSCKNNDFQINLFNIQEDRKKPIFQKDSILYNSPLFFTSICSNLKKFSIDEILSPQSEQLHEIIILSVQKYIYFPQIQIKIQQFLQQYNIKYELYTPFLQIQLEMIKYQKEQQSCEKPFIMVLFLETCHFSNFNKFFKGKFSDTIQVLVNIIKGTFKIRLRKLLRETELNQYLKAIEYKYSIQPQINKIKFASKSEIMMYKKVQAIFQKQEIKATIFSYFLFFLTNKQPLFPKEP